VTSGCQGVGSKGRWRIFSSSSFLVIVATVICGQRSNKSGWPLRLWLLASIKIIWAPKDIPRLPRS
jgi:hypothetical protein